MAAGEYGPVVLTGKLGQSGKLITPQLPDAERVQKVARPSSPRVGLVTVWPLSATTGVACLTSRCFFRANAGLSSSQPPSLFRRRQRSSAAFSNRVNHRIHADRMVVNVASANQSMEPITRRCSGDRTATITSGTQLFQVSNLLGR
jgi:hypothetical protein